MSMSDTSTVVGCIFKRSDFVSMTSRARSSSFSSSTYASSSNNAKSDGTNAKKAQKHKRRSNRIDSDQSEDELIKDPVRPSRSASAPPLTLCASASSEKNLAASSSAVSMDTSLSAAQNKFIKKYITNTHIKFIYPSEEEEEEEEEEEDDNEINDIGSAATENAQSPKSRSRSARATLSQKRRRESVETDSEDDTKSRPRRALAFSTPEKKQSRREEDATPTTSSRKHYSAEDDLTILKWVLSHHLEDDLFRTSTWSAKWNELAGKFPNRTPGAIFSHFRQTLSTKFVRYQNDLGSENFQRLQRAFQKRSKRLYIRRQEHAANFNRENANEPDADPEQQYRSIYSNITDTEQQIQSPSKKILSIRLNEPDFDKKQLKRSIDLTETEDELQILSSSKTSQSTSLTAALNPAITVSTDFQSTTKGPASICVAANKRTSEEIIVPTHSFYEQEPMVEDSTNRVEDNVEEAKFLSDIQEDTAAGFAYKYRSHMNEMPSSEKTQKKFLCSKCGQMFSASSSLKRHLLSHDSKKKQSQCPYCKEWFSREEYVRTTHLKHCSRYNRQQ